MGKVYGGGKGKMPAFKAPSDGREDMNGPVFNMKGQADEFAEKYSLRELEPRRDLKDNKCPTESSPEAKWQPIQLLKHWKIGIHSSLCRPLHFVPGVISECFLKAAPFKMHYSNPPRR